MKKIDIKQEDMAIPKVEYEVYAKLSGENLTKLNLSLCENNNIFISIPLILNDTIDKFNSKSGYYNDICYTTTSENGTDITLADRKEELKRVIKQYVKMIVILKIMIIIHYK